MSKLDTPDDDGQPVAETAEASPEESKATTAGAPEPATPRRRGPYLASGLALICAFCAAAAGFLWWQYRQFYVGLDQADTEAVVSLQAVRASVRALEDRLADLSAENETTRGLAAGLGERVDVLPGRFLDLEERLNAAQGVSDDARRSWLRAEAEYYLTVANAELNLSGRWENAERALGLADDKLLELANPAFAGVRERIAAEFLALRAVRLPDIEGHSFSLSRLAEAGRTLPMRSIPPGVYETANDAPEEEVSGFARVWQSLKSAIVGMVSIERRDDAVVRSLSAEEQALVRQQLELELVLARLGLVRGQREVFQQSLSAATALLERHYDTTAVSVESSIALLVELVDLDIAPARPDISGSLTLLRSLGDRGG